MAGEPSRDIRIGPLLAFALQRTWHARDHLIRLGVLPSLVLLAAALPEMDVLTALLRGADTFGEADTTRLIPLGICYALIISVFAVNWVRQLTLGQDAVPGLGLNIGLRHLKFLLFQMALAFGMLLGSTFLSLVLHPFGISGMLTALMLGMLAWLATIARLSPSWIGIAIDTRMPPAIAWKRTTGQGFKLVLALLAVEVPTMIVDQVAAIVFEVTGLIDAAPFTFLAILWVIELVRIALQISLLVVTYPLFLRETV
ncbi:MAG TPA: hypothetical protein VGM59_09590 [Dongiaceae bacterium]|jgi:hypothetical protein